MPSMGCAPLHLARLHDGVRRCAELRDEHHANRGLYAAGSGAHKRPFAAARLRVSDADSTAFRRGRTNGCYPLGDNAFRTPLANASKFTSVSVRTSNNLPTRRGYKLAHESRRSDSSLASRCLSMCPGCLALDRNRMRATSGGHRQHISTNSSHSPSSQSDGVPLSALLRSGRQCDTRTADSNFRASCLNAISLCLLRIFR